MAESVAPEIEANFCLAWLQNKLIYSAILYPLLNFKDANRCQEKATHDFCYQILGRSFRLGPRLRRKEFNFHVPVILTVKMK